MCAGCGNKAIRAELLPPPVRERKQTTALSKPINTAKMLQSPRPAQKPVAIKPIQNITVMAKSRASSLLLCPICNAPLRSIISGSGPRIRKKCSNCNREFA